MARAIGGGSASRVIRQAGSLFRVVTTTLIVVTPDRGVTAQTVAPSSSLASTTWALRDWTRIERWRFFEPPAGGGDEEYAFGANRLFGSVQRTARAYDLTAALQYVHFGNLPRHATGPGPLGTGAVYYAHAGRPNSYQLYLRYASLRLKRLLPDTTIQIRRMPYSSGGEAASGNPKVEAVKCSESRRVWSASSNGRSISAPTMGFAWTRSTADGAARRSRFIPPRAASKMPPG